MPKTFEEAWEEVSHKTFKPKDQARHFFESGRDAHAPKRLSDSELEEAADKASVGKLNYLDWEDGFRAGYRLAMGEGT